MLDNRLGAQYYTIRDFVQNAEDFDASCKKIADIGYKTVQLSGIGDIPPEKIKESLDKYGLTAVCSHRPAKEYEESIDAVIAWHKTVGCDIAGIGVMPTGFEYDPEAVYAFAEKFSRIADRLHEAGLTFAYHNHSFEFMKMDGKYIFDVIAENTNPETFKFILDAYWVAYAGIDVVELIEKYGDRIAVIHLKDLAIEVNEAKISEVGNGNIKWGRIIDACNRCGVKYALVEQDTCKGDPFDSLKISYDYLTSNGWFQM